MRIVTLLCDDIPMRDMLVLKLEALSLTVSFSPCTDALLVIADTDRYPVSTGEVLPVIGFGYRPPSTDVSVHFSRPFSVASLLRAVENIVDQQARFFTVYKKERRLTYRGYSFSLSPIELSLLTLLTEADGAPLSRTELTQRLFPDASADALTVYIHYLRKKTEADGKKRIYSLRGQGYALRLPREEKLLCYT